MSEKNGRSHHKKIESVEEMSLVAELFFRQKERDRNIREANAHQARIAEILSVIEVPADFEYSFKDRRFSWRDVPGAKGRAAC